MLIVNHQLQQETQMVSMCGIVIMFQKQFQDIISVNIYNTSYAAPILLVHTANGGVASANMTSWMLTLPFIPID